MANRIGSLRSTRERRYLRNSIGLKPDGVDRTPEQNLWYAVLVEGLRDFYDGIYWDKEDFCLVCYYAGCNPTAILKQVQDMVKNRK